MRATSWVFVVLASITATPPVGARNATARRLPFARERTTLRDVLQRPSLLLVRSADPTGNDGSGTVDGDEESTWAGRAGEAQWRLTFTLARPAHIGLLRAHWGQSPTAGVPTAFRWEARRAAQHVETCDTRLDDHDEEWQPLEGAAQTGPLWANTLAQPTRRSWFVDTYACGLRLVVDGTNAAPPVVREVQAIESARDVLRGGRASDDGAYPGFHADAAIDGEYATRWAGAPGKSRWTLRVDLPEPQRIDRVRLVIGLDATTVPRAGAGRSYGVAWAPVRYTLEASEDGESFTPLETEPVRGDGEVLPLRRRLVTLAEPRRVRALRLVMRGATNAGGIADAGAAPVIREIAAYRADDKAPILPAPWFLSVNANPSAQSHTRPGAEIADDAYHARFLYGRFYGLLPEMREDDRYARTLGPHGEWLEVAPGDEAGRGLESIEADDPQLDAQFLARSSPPPIVVLSGSNDWDYAPDSGPDARAPLRWHWDPLRDPHSGGMGQLAVAVQERAAPFLGFCGGAQILALLEAQRSPSSREADQRTIDRVMHRTSGEPIRGFAPLLDLDRAWPTDVRSRRAEIRFVGADRLFLDLAGAAGRSTTRAMPEWHSDAIRADAFGPGGPLERFDLIARSAFCAPVEARDGSGALAAPGTCTIIPEAFRSRDAGWPVIGAQFHAEQRDFATAAPGDPPESTADPGLFLAAAYEALVEAYEKLGP